MRNSGLVLLSFFLFFGLARASNQSEIDSILARDQAPFGVVFEVVEGDGKALSWAIPAINKYVSQLRKRFPDIGLAVVSHGSEQFGLMKSKKDELPAVHKTVQTLVADNVPVQVCGTHASWRGKSAKDYPDYVDVVPAGPTEINNYEDMGYILIVLEKD